jgi:hypothetical protein
MAAIEVIGLSAMLVLSALLTIVVVAGLFSAAEHAAGKAHATARRSQAWGLVRDRPPRTIGNATRSTSSRS